MIKNITIYSSTSEFGRFLKENSKMKEFNTQIKTLVESDANKPTEFYKLPDKVKKLMFLDAADAIITLDSEPILVVEDSREAGTGHNVFQRFPRMTASLENEVPYIYIYPEAAIVDRENAKIKWDPINPLIFKAMFALNSIHDQPALFFYYPSLYNKEKFNLESIRHKGLLLDKEYLGCPNSKSKEMNKMFKVIDDYLEILVRTNDIEKSKKYFKNLPSVREQLDLMQIEFHKKTGNKDWNTMSPLSACEEIDTKKLLNYLKKFENNDYILGNSLKNREKTIIYKINAKFRGDPYPGCLAAIDYLKCRYGKTPEDRLSNLVMVWGEYGIENDKIKIKDNNKSTIKDFVNCVKNSENKSLLKKDYQDLKNYEIPRYYMHIRYGTKYTKVKHLRVYSYYSDAIIFPDGSLWKD